VIEDSQTTVVGIITPGIVGDTLTLTQTAGSLGTLSLGTVQADGTQQVIYTAPSSVVTSTLDAVSYIVTDQHHDAVAAGSSNVQLDAGPTIAAATPSVLEDSQTTVVGTVTPGLASDTLMLTQTTGTGTLSLGTVQADGTQQVIYTAPSSVVTSTLDAVSYIVTDQHHDAVAAGSSNVRLDAGPTIAAATPSVIEDSQTTVVGIVTPGIVGDTLTLTQTAGSLGTLSLGTVQADGTQQVIYTAPASVASSTTDAVSYTVADQHNDAVAAGSSNVQLDAGPTIAAATLTVIEDSQTTVVGIVTPGLAGDTLVLQQTGGSLGTLSLGALQANGTQQVIYTAPATVAASGIDAVSYTIADQHHDVLASGSSNVVLDGGPTITGAVGGQPTTDEATITPFTGVTIARIDDGLTEAVTITPGAAANGTLFDPNAASDHSSIVNGVFTVAGSGAAVTAAVDGLVFTPTAHQVAPGQTVTTNFTIAARDSLGLSATNSAASVVATAVNDPPTITVTGPAGCINGNSSITLFAGVSVTDPDHAAMDSLVISFTNASGAPTDAGGVLSGAGLTKTGIGTYALAATSPASLTQELAALTYAPGTASANHVVATNVTLTATQGNVSTVLAGINTEIVGNGNQTVAGAPGGDSTLVLGNGSNTVTLYGADNTVLGGDGKNIVTGAPGGNSCISLGNGSDSVTLGGSGNCVTVGNGTATISLTGGGSQSVTVGNGNSVIQLAGSNDIVVLGNGSNSVSGSQGMAFITTGTGTNTIAIGGYSNTIDAVGGRDTISGGLGLDTYQLSTAGHGFATISGFTETNGDLLDLRAALGATSWNGAQSTLANFLKVTAGGGNTYVAIAQNGAGSGTQIAQLSGVSYAFADLTSHMIV
jgi:plastocyanin